jgi:cell division protein FtsL
MWQARQAIAQRSIYHIAILNLQGYHTEHHQGELDVQDRKAYSRRRKCENWERFDIEASTLCTNSHVDGIERGVLGMNNSTGSILGLAGPLRVRDSGGFQLFSEPRQTQGTTSCGLARPLRGSNHFTTTRKLDIENALTSF